MCEWSCWWVDGKRGREINKIEAMEKKKEEKVKLKLKK